MSDFLEMRDDWRDALLKEYAEQDFEDDGTLLEINVDTGDDDECCDMIKQKYADTLNYQWSYPKRKSASGKWEYIDKKGYVPMSEFSIYGIDCNRIRQAIERNAYREAGTDPVARQNRKDFYANILKDWDECEKETNSWKNKLR